MSDLASHKLLSAIVGADVSHAIRGQLIIL